MTYRRSELEINITADGGHQAKMQEIEKSLRDGKMEMSTGVTLSMFAALQQSIRDIKTEVCAEVRSDLSLQYSPKIQEMEIAISNESDTIAETIDCIEIQEDDIDTLKCIVLQHKKEISKLNARLIEMERKMMKKNIIISEIKEKKEENCRMETQHFFREHLKMDNDVKFSDAIRIGSGKNRLMLIFLSHKNKEGPIYTKIGNLRDTRNEDGRNFFVNDQLPEQLNEQCRRVQQMKWINSKKDISHRDQITIKKGKVLINDQPYIKKIHCPAAEDFTSLSKEDKDKMGDIFFARSEPKTDKGSIFHTYATNVNDEKDVMLAYLQMKKCYPKLFHIVCAFRLANLSGLSAQDYEDDGEPGGGRALLNMMIDFDIRNKAIFVTRNHGGINLGTRRLELIEQVGKLALESNNVSRITSEVEWPIPDTAAMEDLWYKVGVSLDPPPVLHVILV